MSGDVAERSAKAGKGLRRPKRRISIRIDMTPMVDIAFLLLIFYMVSTVFSMPQAMEINLPPKDQEEEVIVKESNLLTIRVDSESRFWWNLKIVTPQNLPKLIPSALKPDSVVYAFNADSLQGLLTTQNRDIGGGSARQPRWPLGCSVFAGAGTPGALGCGIGATSSRGSSTART